MKSQLSKLLPFLITYFWNKYNQETEKVSPFTFLTMTFPERDKCVCCTVLSNEV